MAGLDHPDFELDVLYEINGLAERLSGRTRDVVTFVGEYGLPFVLVALVGLGWLLVRRRADAPQAVAGCFWALLAAGLTWAANVPIRAFVARPRPHESHAELIPMVDGRDGYSFVSDHAGAATAIAVALFLVHRVLGLVALGLALLQGAARVLMGVHYPTDVIGGFALGMAVALLLAPLGMALLTPLVRALAGVGWLGWLARPPADDPERERDPGERLAA
ncbi:phosphatase PAP2 family protein [Streptomyces profundus]|uniref:phosphatase PAP2 family protein n=1 Tax=Streptomyces profundus TaxID=2867410 RepID=UPI002240F37B|nr:phosphatase PAP2 family protein [Streptomyces sp. MA3_2.13]UED84911.1 phosphatase PAP2 family protein [Streptomyces sp. MA3_2.13]